MFQDVSTFSIVFPAFPPRNPIARLSPPSSWIVLETLIPFPPASYSTFWMRFSPFGTSCSISTVLSIAGFIVTVMIISLLLSCEDFVNFICVIICNMRTGLPFQSIGSLKVCTEIPDCKTLFFAASTPCGRASPFPMNVEHVFSLSSIASAYSGST